MRKGAIMNIISEQQNRPLPGGLPPHSVPSLSMNCFTSPCGQTDRESLFRNNNSMGSWRSLYEGTSLGEPCLSQKLLSSVPL
ncbi:hypothetical protein FOXYSP1_18331 [Fusarium oxysporum f. sp. phaseoli]